MTITNIYDNFNVLFCDQDKITEKKYQKNYNDKMFSFSLLFLCAYEGPHCSDICIHKSILKILNTKDALKWMIQLPEYEILYIKHVYLKYVSKYCVTIKNKTQIK